MMSSSVDNQFAGLVAYGQHGPGYPALGAGHEASQGVAAQINAGQVNADNGIADNGVTGQGTGLCDVGAAAAPAPAGQAAKDPLRRPDDAKPFQCVIIADGTHKIKFGQTDIFCRVAIKDETDIRGWRFICDARPYANGSLKDHIAATRGPHWKAGDLIKVLNMADLRKIDQDILGPLVDCIVTQDERDDVKAARRDEQRQQLGQQLGQQQPQPHDQQQEGQPRRYQRAPDGRLLNGITNGRAAQLYMPGVTTMEDARLAAESFTITMVPLPPGQGFAYYHESAPVSGRSLALHEVRFGNAYTQWQQQTPRTQGRILGEINGPEQGLLNQQPGLHADAYEGGQQQEARFEQNHEDGYGRDYHQQQVARYQQQYASPGHQQQIERQQNDQADGGNGGRAQHFANAPQPQQIGYGGYSGGRQQFAGPSQPQQNYSPAVGSQQYGPPVGVNGANGGLGGPGQQSAGQRQVQGQGSRGDAADFSPNLDPLLYHQGPGQRRGDGLYGRNCQA